MGSFNTTCFASQQTLASGDECYVIPIIQQSAYEPIYLGQGDEMVEVQASYNTTCYPDAFWKPMGFVIKAKYDDYGRVITDASLANMLCINDFNAALAYTAHDTQQGENEYHDHSFVVKDWRATDSTQSWEYMWKAAMGNRIFSGQNPPRQFSFAIMSAQAFDYLLNSNDTAVGYNGKTHSRDDKISELLAEVVEKFKLGTGLPIGTVVSSALYQIVHRVQELCNTRHSGGRASNHEFVLAVAEEIYTTGTLSDVRRAEIKEKMAFGRVIAALDELNIKITPLVYASQDYDNSVGAEYAKFVSTVSEQICKQRRYNDTDE